ncbi:MAG TPA: potassium/proton antiporter [Gemmatimonadales bacterium]|nr:potassium/proton antiporter [Gemmatimonadales bacterium]
MHEASRLMLIAGVLLAAGVLSSRLSARSGVPVALLFVTVGLLAGDEGVLGIPFSDAELASQVSIVLLALILFDGGLSTSLDHVRRAAGPATSLATVGVVLSAMVVAVAAVALLDFGWVQGLLLGSILGSTDAAAVFSTLRGRGGTLRPRLRTVLELESGLNDPLAVFLTVALTGVAAAGAGPPPWWHIAGMFVWQMTLGIAGGAAAGWFTARLIRAVRLDAAGLYLVLTLACALVAFGGPQLLGGSGVIGAYTAGLVVGNSRIASIQGIRRFHDGIAWLSQVGVFVLLGLLAFPSRLIEVAPSGLAIALTLALVARPLAVFVATAPFGLRLREQLVVACGGLRGTTPVILATIPLAAGLADAWTIFHLVFFAVMVSVLLQGTSLAPLARRMGLAVPYRGEPPVALEFTAIRETGQQLLGYRVEPGSVADGKAIRALPLPEGALIALVVRDAEVIPPRGSTVLKADDVAYVLHATGAGGAVTELFAPAVVDEAALPAGVDVPLPLDARVTTLGDVEAFYGVRLSENADQVLAEWLAERMPERPSPGQRVPLGPIEVVVASVQDGRPHMVGIEVRGEPPGV